MGASFDTVMVSYFPRYCSTCIRVGWNFPLGLVKTSAFMSGIGKEIISHISFPLPEKSKCRFGCGYPASAPDNILF